MKRGLLLSIIGVSVLVVVVAALSLWSFIWGFWSYETADADEAAGEALVHYRESLKNIDTAIDDVSKVRLKGALKGDIFSGDSAERLKEENEKIKKSLDAAKSELFLYREGLEKAGSFKVREEYRRYLALRTGAADSLDASITKVTPLMTTVDAAITNLSYSKEFNDLMLSFNYSDDLAELSKQMRLMKDKLERIELEIQPLISTGQIPSALSSLNKDLIDNATKTISAIEAVNAGDFARADALLPAAEASYKVQTDKDWEARLDSEIGSWMENAVNKPLNEARQSLGKAEDLQVEAENLYTRDIGK